MVKYTPKEFKDNPNVSPRSFVKEALTLLTGLLVIILVIYIALGFAVDLIVPRLPEEVEENLGRLYSTAYSRQAKKENDALQGKCQELLDSLVEHLPDPEKKYTVYVSPSPQVNAFAAPGKNVIILSGLLKEVESENELCFVLAHELGHFAHKDHLRGLGRGLVFFVISSVFLGQDSSISNFLGKSLTNAEMKFSQQQETAADLFAIDLLNKKYGHVGGSTDFLKKMKQKEKVPRFMYFFATHPHPSNRLKNVEKKIKAGHYQIKDTTPLEDFFKDQIENLGKPPGKTEESEETEK